MKTYPGKEAVIIAEQRLIVDCVRSAIRRMGMPNLVFGHPNEALAFLQSRHADILIVDDSLSHGNAVEFIARLRVDSSIVSRLIPVILLSDNGRPETIMRAIKGGIDEVLIKPISEKIIGARVQTTIESPRKCISVASGYVGPDRRRSVRDLMGAEDRRANDQAEVVPRSTKAK